MDRVIAVNRFYWPSEAATSQLLTDLARWLADEGATVHVVAGRRIAPGARDSLAPCEIMDGVTIHRVWSTMIGGPSLLARAIDYLTFYLSSSYMLLRLARKGDRLLIKTDPPLMSVPAALVAMLRQARLIVWHQDIFPETAEAVGVVRRGGVLSRVARWLRNQSLRSVETNVVICEAMAETLHRQGVRHDRIRVIPNWSDARLHPVAPAQNPLRRSWGLSGKLVIGYSGNLGRVHQVNAVAQLIRSTEGLDNLVWLFVGGGVASERIEALQEELPNGFLVTKPAQPRAALGESLSVPDIHLVSLDPACEGLVMPSKLYGAMAAGRPVLNLGAEEGAVAQIISRYDIGITLDPSRPEGWRETVEEFVADRSRLIDMGRRGRALIQDELGAKKCLSEWQRVLTVACPSPQEEVRRSLPRERAAEQVGGAG